MDGFDNATWQALGLVLTLLGLAVSVLVWVRRGAVSGLRAVAWSLLPAAAGLTGVLRLGWEVTDAVVDWAVRLVFSPLVWLGLVVAGVSMVLFVVTGFLRRRTEARGGGSEAAAGRSSAPSAAPSSEPRAVGRERSSPAAGGIEDDLADVEEILRRRGIQ